VGRTLAQLARLPAIELKGVGEGRAKALASLDIETVLEHAAACEKAGRARTFSHMLDGYLLATIFLEPSTRTRLSFEAAMLRLGGQMMGTDNAREFSSAAKGETLEDSIRIVSGYADVIVIRHNEEGAAKRAASVSSVKLTATASVVTTTKWNPPAAAETTTVAAAAAKAAGGCPNRRGR